MSVVNVWVSRDYGIAHVRIIDGMDATRWYALTGMRTVQVAQAEAARVFGMEVVCYSCHQTPFPDPGKHIAPHGVPVDTTIKA
mgnify:FL=1